MCVASNVVFAPTRRLDSEMKMELARRLDAALMDYNAVCEDNEQLKREIAAMHARAVAAAGGDPASVPAPAGLIAQAAGEWYYDWETRGGCFPA